ncbi:MULTISPECIES: hypothetical protein [unclassified Streptomyces]|nr:hypothetical protein [Streptomyces sp. NBC_01761]WSC52026.1 hypothetical protein OG808_06990 [Streptomyces sp. NBC_01761]WSF82874.1 hypothetical protein OIE70_07075 [Streptomyces sp. NBC_01744]
MVICGDDGLARRLAVEPDAVCGEAVTVILPSRRDEHGAEIAALDRDPHSPIELLVATHLDAVHPRSTDARRGHSPPRARAGRPGVAWPRRRLAEGAARASAVAAGLHEVDVVTRVVTDRAEAERIGFTGSPTVLIDGEDPFAEAGRTQGMACRLYRTPEGLDGAPSVGQLHQALATAFHHES